MTMSKIHIFAKKKPQKHTTDKKEKKNVMCLFLFVFVFFNNNMDNSL